MKFPFFPEQASTAAGQVDHLYLFLAGFSACWLILIGAFILVFLLRYRRGRRADRSRRRVPTTPIEITWTVVPLLMTLGLFAWGADVYHAMEIPPAGALEVNVVGRQWMWKLQHREGRREINELHVPVGRPVKLTLASEDVIHSFFVPAFRVKQDAVPGRFVTQWFLPTKVGTYHLFCAEYCGKDHSLMGGTVHVMSVPDYEHWLAGGGADEPPTQAGARLYVSLGCSGCHEGSPVVAAPALANLYGSLVQLSDGRRRRVDEGYLRTAILAPATQLHHGQAPLMPAYQGRVCEEELMQLIDFLRARSDLREEARP